MPLISQRSIKNQNTTFLVHAQMSSQPKANRGERDRDGRAVVKISMNEVNIQQRLVENAFARVYKMYVNQYPWSL